MAEEKDKRNFDVEKKEEKTVEDEEVNNTTELIESANDAAERIEEANKKSEELITRQEALAVKDALGGKSEAGAEEKKEEETPKDYAKRVMANDLEEKEDGNEKKTD